MIIYLWKIIFTLSLFFFNLKKNNNQPHTLYFNEFKNDDPFFSFNSPASLKSTSLNQKPKLATIHELPQLFKSKSTTEITNANNFKNQFDDDFKVKSIEDDNCSNLSEIGLNLRNENSSLNCGKNFEESFFCNEELPSPANNLINNQDNPFLIKTPLNFKSQQSKERKDLAVDLRNISYQYGYGRKANKVLNDVTLRVPLGGIYGLLGPSGKFVFYKLLKFNFKNLIYYQTKIKAVAKHHYLKL